MIPPRIANGVIVLVSIVFAINFGAQFVIPSYKPDPYIYGVFMTLVGGSFALKHPGRTTPEPPAPKREKVSGGDRG